MSGVCQNKIQFMDFLLKKHFKNLTTSIVEDCLNLYSIGSDKTASVTQHPSQAVMYNLLKPELFIHSQAPQTFVVSP